MTKFIGSVLLGLLFFNGHSQIVINGQVLDSLTKNPIEGATVFFDQTSIWALTDSTGHFNLQMKMKTTIPLIVSYLGYERKILKKPFEKEELTVFLKRAKNELEAVVLKGHHKAGRKKERGKFEKERLREWPELFVHFFIGAGESAKKNRLLNPEELRFSYDSVRNAVSVSANAPLVIENDYLKYRILYTLDTASIGFAKNNEFHMLLPKTFSLAGTSFFQDLLDPAKKNQRFHKRREEAYLGSVLHFMRWLKKERPPKEGFSVYTTTDPVSTGEKGQNEKTISPAHFKIISRTGFTEIIPPPKFTVIYQGKKSEVSAKQNFGIDAFGNFFPWYALKFGGDMGITGVSSLLPLDYWPEK